MKHENEISVLRLLAACFGEENVNPRFIAKKLIQGKLCDVPFPELFDEEPEDPEEVDP